MALLPTHRPTQTKSTTRITLTAATIAALTTACGGSAKHPDTATNASGSDESESPAWTHSTGASPIHIEWTSSTCDIEVRDAVGATYRFDDGARGKVEDSVKRAFEQCMGPNDRAQGTAYVHAKVAASGSVAQVRVSPGGAMPSGVVACLGQSFSRIRVPAPLDGESVLLVLAVSSCAGL